MLVSVINLDFSNMGDFMQSSPGKINQDVPGWSRSDANMLDRSLT